jgi:shikimate dehydrogenase
MKHYVMIGAPVTSVRTPPLLEAFLANEGVAASITAQHLEPESLPGFMREVRDDAMVDGLLVTMPHKRLILPELMAVAASARQAGSVNAVKRDAEGDLVGAQFDGIGLLQALRRREIDLAQSRVLLLGLGGAGFAIAHALAAHGCARLDLFDLDDRLLADAVTALRDSYALPVGAAMSGPGHYDFLINATPIGMKADDLSPFDEALIRSVRAVADITADPNRTRLAALVRDANRTLVTGRDMVEGQIAPIGRWLLADGPVEH